MNFSNRFKIGWWVSILVVLTGLSIWRVYLKSFTDADIFLFVFWFIIVLFPIISEISFLGINVKKEIQNATDEIKSYISQITNNNQTNININTTEAKSNEHINKVKEEIKEEEDAENNVSGFSPRTFIMSESPDEDDKVQAQKKSHDRLNKILMIEKLVGEHLRHKFEDSYKPQIKFEDTITKEKIILDGIIYNQGQIDRVIEIKYITEKSFSRLFFIASNFIHKLTRVGLRYPILFIIVSESLNRIEAQSIKVSMDKLHYNKKLNPFNVSVSVSFFKISEDSLQEIEL